MRNDDTPTTNSQLLKAIYEKQAIHGDQISTIEKKLDYTNGKVASLIEDKIRREEAEKVRKEYESQQPQTVINTKNATVSPKISDEAINKLIIGFAALVGGIGAAITLIVGGPQ